MSEILLQKIQGCNRFLKTFRSWAHFLGARKDGPPTRSVLSGRISTVENR